MSEPPARSSGESREPASAELAASERPSAAESESGPGPGRVGSGPGSHPDPTLPGPDSESDPGPDSGSDPGPDSGSDPGPDPTLPGPDSHDPPRIFTLAPENPRAWPVYLMTILMLPLTVWMTQMFMALTVLALAAIAIYRGELAASDLGLYAQRELIRIFNPQLPQLVVGVLSASSACALAAFLLATRGRANEERGLTTRRLRLVRTPLADVLLAIAGLLGLTFALEAIITLAGLNNYGALSEMRATIEALDLGERFALSLVVAFGAGISEELYFRGFMLPRLELAHGRTAALIITSLAFGLFHFDLLHSPVAAAMGAFLGVTVLITGSLWPAIAAHTANNFIAVIFAGAETSKTAAFALLPAGLIVCTFALRALRRRHRGDEFLPVW